MQKIFRAIFGLLLWPCLVVIALNIQYFATALGLDKVLAENANEATRMLRAAGDFAREPWVLYGAIFVLGSAINASLYTFLGKLERRNPEIALWRVRNRCATAGNQLRWYKMMKYTDDVHDRVRQANLALKAHGIATVYIDDLEDAEQRIRAANHFKAIEPLLSKANVDHARTISKSIAQTYGADLGAGI
jgi:hypothetical protein